MRNRAVLGALIAASWALFAACGGVSQEDLADVRAEAARAAEGGQRAQVMAALEPLDPLRYHHLDGMIRDEGMVPTDALVWATRARETLRWVSWPSELAPHVAQYGEWLDALLTRLRAGDAEAASEPSRLAHALAHTFEAALEAWLNGEAVPAPPELAGLEPPSHGGHGSAGHGSGGQGSMDGMSGDDEDGGDGG